MKKSLIAMALAVAAFGASAEGLKPLAYPGSAWSVSSASFSGAAQINRTAESSRSLRVHPNAHAYAWILGWSPRNWRGGRARKEKGDGGAAGR